MSPMYLYKQNNMKFLKNILLGALSVSHIFLLIGSCANSLNQQNYLECKPKLEQDPQKARSGQEYSYKSQSF